MKTFTRSIVLTGTLALVTPALSWADNIGWYKGEDRLDQRLQPGQSPAAYREQLRELGYKVTAVNYNTPDYVEYEVVKGDRTYEVQIDVDDDTGLATEIDIAANVWKTDVTQAALNAPESIASLNDPNYIMVITPIYTVDTRERTALEKMVRDLEQIPAGESKGSYRNALQERGYQVMDKTKKNNRTQFRVSKDGREALVHVRFNAETGKAEQVNAFPLLLNATARQSSSMDTARAAQPLQAGEMRQVLQELEALPVSRDRDFYRQALRQHGFQITNTDVNDDRTRFEAEKNGQRIALQVEFDESTGRSTDVTASSLKGATKEAAQVSKKQDSQQQDQMAQRESGAQE